MKIPQKIRIGRDSAETNALKEIWKTAAREASMNYGIYVEVSLDYEDPNGYYIERICFKIMDHEFESLQDLKRALEQKAFL